MWRHTRRGDRYVTVMIDLTPVRDRSGPARLLDMVPGRSKKALQDLALPARPGLAWAGRGGSHGAVSPGPESAADQELPQARTVMDPFHVVRLGGEALDSCRRRVQRATKARRGRKGDPLHRARRTLLTGADLRDVAAYLDSLK